MLVLQCNLTLQLQHGSRANQRLQQRVMTWILPPSSSLKEAYNEVCEDVSLGMCQDSLFSTLAPHTLDTKTWHYDLADCETGCSVVLYTTQSTHVSAIYFLFSPANRQQMAVNPFMPAV